MVKTISSKECFFLSNFRAAKKFDNSLKNHYTDMLPYDYSKVILKVDPKNDYINANHIANSSLSYLPKFIATQAPLPSTFEDFWEMVLQECCPVIVMLKDEVKDYYFPLEAIERREYYIEINLKKGFTIRRMICAKESWNVSSGLCG
eukprot:Gb_05248 [translate_table: standard]